MEESFDPADSVNSSDLTDAQMGRSGRKRKASSKLAESIESAKLAYQAPVVIPPRSRRPVSSLTSSAHSSSHSSPQVIASGMSNNSSNGSYASTPALTIGSGKHLPALSVGSPFVPSAVPASVSLPAVLSSPALGDRWQVAPASAGVASSAEIKPNEVQTIELVPRKSGSSVASDENTPELKPTVAAEMPTALSAPVAAPRAFLADQLATLLGEPDSAAASLAHSAGVGTATQMLYQLEDSDNDGSEGDDRRSKKARAPVHDDKSGSNERLMKGLRHFSVKVCEKLSKIKRTTYNTMAKELVDEFIAEHKGTDDPSNQFDEKNIRRRIYDALNVLMAINIITKDKKEIVWRGLEAPSKPEATAPATDASSSGPSTNTAASTAKGREQLLAQIAASQARVHARFQQTKALLHEHLAWKTMLERNQLEKEKENHSIADVSMTEHVKDETAKDTVTAPFVLLRVPEDAEVGLLVTSDRQHVSLVFSHPFRVYDDHSLIQQLCPLPDESQLEATIPAHLQALFSELTAKRVGGTNSTGSVLSTMTTSNKAAASRRKQQQQQQPQVQSQRKQKPTAGDKEAIDSLVAIGRMWSRDSNERHAELSDEEDDKAYHQRSSALAAAAAAARLHSPIKSMPSSMPSSMSAMTTTSFMQARSPPTIPSFGMSTGSLNATSTNATLQSRALPTSFKLAPGGTVQPSPQLGAHTVAQSPSSVTAMISSKLYATTGSNSPLRAKPAFAMHNPAHPMSSAGMNGNHINVGLPSASGTGSGELLRRTSSATALFSTSPLRYVQTAAHTSSSSLNANMLTSRASLFPSASSLFAHPLSAVPR